MSLEPEILKGRSKAIETYQFADAHGAVVVISFVDNAADRIDESIDLASIEPELSLSDEGKAQLLKVAEFVRFVKNGG